MLPKKHRISQKKDFAKIFRRAKFFPGRFFLLRSVENNLELSRFAIIIPKTFSKKAVIRNKIRRQVYSIVQKEMIKINPGFDNLFTIKKQTDLTNFLDCEKDILILLKKAGVISYD
jgi:ribonuclease P protein component